MFGPLPCVIFRATAACSNRQSVFEDLIKPTAQSLRHGISTILMTPIRQIAKYQRSRPPEQFGLEWLQAQDAIIPAASSTGNCDHFYYTFDGEASHRKSNFGLHRRVGPARARQVRFR